MAGSHAPQRGVTLIETLIALFVIALMATVGAVMTGQSLRGANAVEAKGDASTDLSIALGMIRDDLAAHVPRASQDPGLIDTPALFEGYAPRHDGKVMALVRNGWVNPAGETRSGMQRVEYQLSGGKLVRRSWAAADPAPGSRSAEIILLEGLSSLEVRFGRGDTWSSEWANISGADLPLPQKAEFTLTFTDGDELKVRVLVGNGA